MNVFDKSFLLKPVNRHIIVVSDTHCSTQFINYFLVSITTIGTNYVCMCLKRCYHRNSETIIVPVDTQNLTTKTTVLFEPCFLMLFNVFAK